jgi:Flp pilus assembly pilin Flp
MLDMLACAYVRVREWHKAQTMTEYALILSAVAVVVYAGYQAMGGSISSLLNSVDGNL